MLGIHTMWKLTSNHVYLIQFFLACVMALTGKLVYFCSDTPCTRIYERVSYTLGTYFISMTGLTYKYPNLHEGYWIFKFIAYCGLIFGSFFVPYIVLNVFSYFAQVASVLFLVLEQVIVLDFIITMNEKFKNLVINANSVVEERYWTFSYLIVGILLFIGDCYGIDLLYENMGNCFLHMALISITLLAGLLITLLSICSKVGRGLIAGTLVFLNNIYLCWMALSNNRNTSCANNYSGNNIVLGLIIGSLSIFWTSFRSATWTLFQGKTEDKPRHWLYHVVLSFGGLYLAMLMTNWNETNGLEGNIILWTKIGIHWFSILLYSWILFAPVCFPDRDFAVENVNRV